MNLTSPKNWKTVKLGDLTEIRRGSSPRPIQDFLSPTGMPWVKISDATADETRFIHSTRQFIKEEGIKNTVIVNEGDFIVSNSATPGLPKFMKITAGVHDGWLIIKPNETIIDKLFLYYQMIYDRPRLVGQASGAVFDNLKTDTLKDHEFPLPPLEDQREIALILGSLDDKIELLRRENKTLESIAQALFREWFVEFRFPGYEGVKVVDGVPEGWKVGKLGDICINFDSKRVPLASDVRAIRKGIYPYYGATQIMDYIDDYLFEGTYLLLAEDASVMDDKGFPVLQYVEGQFWVSNHAHVLQGLNTYSTEMLYLLMRQTPVAGIVTGAVQLKINQENLLSLPVVIPTKDISDLFNQVITSQFQKLKVNRKEIQTLSRLRDDLLNKIFNV